MKSKCMSELFGGHNSGFIGCLIYFFITCCAAVCQMKTTIHRKCQNRYEHISL